MKDSAKYIAFFLSFDRFLQRLPKLGWMFGVSFFDASKKLVQV